MSWGIRIAILYIGFMILILSMVAMTMGEKIELVSKDYYAQEIKYQERIDRIERTSNLKESLQWEVKQGILRIKFPENLKGNKISAHVNFFRPSDSDMDRTITLPADTSLTRNILTDKLHKGIYKIQISWGMTQEEYYNEGTVQLN